MIKIANNLQQLVNNDIKTLNERAANSKPFSEVYDSVANTMPFITGLGGAAGGGLLGAGIGGLVEYLRDKKKKNYLKALLVGGGIGAGTGGLLGGGAGYLAASTAKNIKNLALAQESRLAPQRARDEQRILDNAERIRREVQNPHLAQPEQAQAQAQAQSETPQGPWSLGILSALLSGGETPDNSIHVRIGD